MIRPEAKGTSPRGDHSLDHRDQDDEEQLVAAAREDASSFVASDGAIRGPYLEAMLVKLRHEQPQLEASDMQLASAILAAEQH